MESKENRNFKFMYRRGGTGDKYLDITKVLDEILNRLDAIEETINNMESND